MSAHRLKLNGLVMELWATLSALAVALALLAGCAAFWPTTPAGAEFLWLLMYVPTETGVRTRESLRYDLAAAFFSVPPPAAASVVPLITHPLPAATPRATSCATWAWTSRKWPSST